MIRIIAFTNKGYRLGERIGNSFDDAPDAELYFKGRTASDVGIQPAPESLDELCGAAFERSIPLVFIGAAGIAVRSVAPYVRDKLTDPPVVVIDELGRYVIPVLSGHMGGGNELALRISDVIGAEPVITTATDINGAFSVDVFAREKGLSIQNREGIARVSASALEGRPVTISIKDYPPAEPVDVVITDDPTVFGDTASLVLCPKKYALGIGCRRGKTFEELRDFALKVLEESGIGLNEIGCLATIDVKKDEEGLRQLSQAWRIPMITFDAAVLRGAEGEFTSSETVLEKVGVDNVCERAAAVAAGTRAKLVIRKTAKDGTTAAVAERYRDHAGTGDRQI